jgi:hypothetical protein
MKTDFYTKSILTVIAVCLTILTLQNVDLIPKAYAVEKNDNLNVLSTKNYGLVPVNANGTIDVNIKSCAPNLNVNVNNKVDVNIDKVGGGYVSSGGPIPVKIK